MTRASNGAYNNCNTRVTQAEGVARWMSKTMYVLGGNANKEHLIVVKIQKVRLEKSRKH